MGASCSSHAHTVVRKRSSTTLLYLLVLKFIRTGLALFPNKTMDLGQSADDVNNDKLYHEKGDKTKQTDLKDLTGFSKSKTDSSLSPKEEVEELTSLNTKLSRYIDR